MVSVRTAEAAEGDGGDDDHPREDLLHERGPAPQVAAIGEGAHEERPHEGATDGSRAPGEAGAPEHHGRDDVELGDQPAVECGPGTIIEIPPKVMHFVVSKGETPLKVLVLYSPPLPPREDTPVD